MTGDRVAVRLGYLFPPQVDRYTSGVPRTLVEKLQLARPSRAGLIVTVAAAAAAIVLAAAGGITLG